MYIMEMPDMATKDKTEGKDAAGKMWREENGLMEMLLSYIGEFNEFSGWSNWLPILTDILSTHEEARRRRNVPSLLSVNLGTKDVDIKMEAAKALGDAWAHDMCRQEKARMKSKRSLTEAKLETKKSTEVFSNPFNPGSSASSKAKIRRLSDDDDKSQSSSFGRSSVDEDRSLHAALADLMQKSSGVKGETNGSKEDSTTLWPPDVAVEIFKLAEINRRQSEKGASEVDAADAKQDIDLTVLESYDEGGMSDAECDGKSADKEANAKNGKEDGVGKAEKNDSIDVAAIAKGGETSLIQKVDESKSDKDAENMEDEEAEEYECEGGFMIRLSTLGKMSDTADRKTTDEVKNESKTHESKTDKSKTHESKRDKSKTHESMTDKSKTHESKTDKSKTHESKTDKSKAHESKTDKSKTHESKTDKSKTHESKADKSRTDKSKANPSQGRRVLLSSRNVSGLNKADRRNESADSVRKSHSNRNRPAPSTSSRMERGNPMSSQFSQQWHSCMKCGGSFGTQRMLQDHYCADSRTTSAPKPSRCLLPPAGQPKTSPSKISYACLLCGESFNVDWHLKIHMRHHNR